MSPEFDRRALRDLSYGLYIVTSLDGDRLNGQIVNTVIQVTSDPRIYFEEWAVWGIRTG
jgi:flavin reductase (DIM6/NTAB) family NADH-FMN oxidoreductase RutF